MRPNRRKTLLCLLAAQLALAACHAEPTAPPAAAPVPSTAAPAAPEAMLERVPTGDAMPSLADPGEPTEYGHLALKIGLDCGGGGKFERQVDFNVILARPDGERERFPVVLPANGVVTLQHLEPGEVAIALTAHHPNGDVTTAELGTYTIAPGQSRLETPPCESLAAIASAIAQGAGAVAGGGVPPGIGGVGYFPGGAPSYGKPSPRPSPRRPTGQPVRVVERDPVLTKPSYLGARYRQAGGKEAAPVQIGPKADKIAMDDQSQMIVAASALASATEGRYYAMADDENDGFYRILGRVRFEVTRRDPNNLDGLTLVARLGGHTRRFFFTAEGRLLAVGYGKGAKAQFMFVDPEEVNDQQFAGALYPHGTPARLFYFLDDHRQISELFIGKLPGQDGLLGLSFSDPKLGYVHLQRMSF